MAGHNRSNCTKAVSYPKCSGPARHSASPTVCIQIVFVFSPLVALMAPALLLFPSSGLKEWTNKQTKEGRE